MSILTLDKRLGYHNCSRTTVTDRVGISVQRQSMISGTRTHYNCKHLINTDPGDPNLGFADGNCDYLRIKMTLE